MIKQISVSLENSRGRLYETIQTMGEAGIDLRALSLNAARDFGVARMIVSNVALARRILMEKQISACIDDVVAVEIEDKPRSLESVLQALSEAGTNIEYLYAFATPGSKKAVLIFSFTENKEAVDTLTNTGARILSAEDLGIIDTNQK